MKQNLSKVNPKSTKSQWKIDHKSIKHRTENHQNRTGAKHVARFVFGVVLEESWARLGDQDTSKFASQNRWKIDKRNYANVDQNPLPSKFQISKETKGLLAPKSDKHLTPTSKG